MRNPLKAALAACVLSTISFPALADVKAGIDAWERGDYPTAIAAWRPLAEQGDADAQFNLGQAYRFGKGVPVDLALAELWYRRAAGQGHVQAEDNLALVLFQAGKHKDALPLIRKAADRGDARAQFVLGTILFNGDLAQRDWPAAYAYTIRAANAGLPKAQLRLTEMDRYLSPEERHKGQSLAQQMDASAAAPEGQGQPIAPPAPALLAARSQALPPPAQAMPPAPSTESPLPIAPPMAAPEAAPERSAPDATAQPPQSAAPVPPASGQMTAEPPAPLPTPVPDPVPAPGPVPVPGPVPAPVPVATSPSQTRPVQTPLPQPFAKPSPAARGWRVQFGAFSDPKGARMLWQTLRLRVSGLAGLNPQFERAGSVTRLRAGPLANQAAAQHLCNQAKGIGQACLVVAP